jgi:hypothetical protein
MCTIPIIYYTLFTLTQGQIFMNNDHITPSILTVIPTKDLDILNDLNCQDTKSIASLIEENTNEKEKDQNTEEIPAISG